MRFVNREQLGSAPDACGNALALHGSLGWVSQATRRDSATIDASDPLAGAAEKLRTGQVRSMMVLRDGQLAGLLTLENVREFASIQAALEKSVSGDKIEVMRTT